MVDAVARGATLRCAASPKYLAILAILAMLQETPRELRVFKMAQGCQVAMLERGNCKLNHYRLEAGRFGKIVATD
jgi:hypothetical protein